MSEEAILGGIGGLAVGLALGSAGARAVQGFPGSVYVESWDFLGSGYMEVTTEPRQMIAPVGARAVLIRSPNTNTATIWLGNAAVTKENGLPLYAGESLMIAVKNLDNLYLVSESGVQRIYLFFVGARG